MKKIILALIIILPLFSAYSEDNKALTFDTSVGFFSDYMFRGFNLYDGASIQPSLKMNYDMEDAGVFHASLWMHLPGETQNRPEKFSELDATITYDYTVDDITFSLGHVWYTYPNETDAGIPESAEFFASVAFDTTLSPVISAYHDYREFDAQYYEALLSHRIECASLGEGFNLTPYVSFGFASNAEKVYQDNGLVQITTGLSTEAPLGDITVIPTINYTFESDKLATNEFWVGTTFSYSF